jgi:hypothetical protein
METEYYANPEFDHVFEYYRTFRNKEGFIPTPADLNEVYNQYEQDCPMFNRHIKPFGRRLNRRAFLKVLDDTDKNYMAQWREQVSRIHEPREYRDNPVLRLEKPHSNEPDSGDNIPEPDEFMLHNAASYQDRIDAWERREERREELSRRQANPEIRSLRDMIMQSMVDNTNGVSEYTRNWTADRWLERLSAMGSSNAR